MFVPNWFTCCEHLPELPSIQGWVEAMTSLGRLIFFDQPGSGASDPVEPGALPTLEQWADSITAVLDALGSREAVLITWPGSFPTAALFAATYPSRTTALVVLEGYAIPVAERTEWAASEEITRHGRHVGHRRMQHAVNPDMPWNEHIRAAWARFKRLAVSQRIVALLFPLFSELDVRSVLSSIPVSTLVCQHADDPISRQIRARTSPIAYRARNTLSFRGSNVYHFVEPVA